MLLPTPSLYPLLYSVLTNSALIQWHSLLTSVKCLEVLLDPADLDFLRYLCHSPGGEVEDWRMLHITLGVASSQYLASQVLQQIAQDHQQQYPDAAAVVQSTFYVDDCLNGAKDTDKAIQLQQDFYQLLQKGKMTLRKWRSNNPEVIASIPDELCEPDHSNLVVSELANCNKILRIHWNTTKEQTRLLLTRLSQ